MFTNNNYEDIIKYERSPKLKMSLRWVIALHKACLICQAHVLFLLIVWGRLTSEFQQAFVTSTSGRPNVIFDQFMVILVRYHWFNRIFGGLSDFSDTGEGTLAIMSG